MLWFYTTDICDAEQGRLFFLTAQRGHVSENLFYSKAHKEGLKMDLNQHVLFCRSGPFKAQMTYCWVWRGSPHLCIPLRCECKNSPVCHFLAFDEQWCHSFHCSFLSSPLSHSLFCGCLRFAGNVAQGCVCEWVQGLILETHSLVHITHLSLNLKHWTSCWGEWTAQKWSGHICPKILSFLTGFQRKVLKIMPQCIYK